MMKIGGYEVKSEVGQENPNITWHEIVVPLPVDMFVIENIVDQIQYAEFINVQVHAGIGSKIKLRWCTK